MIRRLTPAMARASAWMDERSARERLLLRVLAVLGLIAVLWYGVIQPLSSARAQALERIALYEDLQARLRLAPPGSSAQAPTAVLVQGPLVDAARQAAAAQGLAAEIEGDAERVTVTIPNARFDAAVPFLRALEGGGATLSDVRMQATAQPGLVNLTLVAARP